MLIRSTIYGNIAQCCVGQPIKPPRPGGGEQPRFGNDGAGSTSLAYLLIIIAINATHTRQMIIKTTIFIAAACSLRNNTPADSSN